MAFDKALSQAPNFPMALWGKGMVLYQEKKDFAGAREVLERLLNLVPPGEERNEVVKVLAEYPDDRRHARPLNRRRQKHRRRFIFISADQRQDHHRSKTQSQRGLSSDSLHHRAACQRC